MRHFRRTKALSSVLFVLAIAGLVALPQLPSAGPESDLERAWRTAARAGSYAFTMEIAQQSDPLPTIANVGRQSKTQRLYFEGAANLVDASLDLRAWDHGGTVLDPASAVEIRVDEQGTRARSGGQPWQEVDGLSDLFAPTGDPLAFTAAASDVRVVEDGPALTAAVKRYSYIIDGPRYAAFVREQLQARLIRTGQLPPGVSLKLSDAYQQMEGSGELWIDGAGLPRRQVIQLEFPEKDGHRTSANITVDFSRFGFAAQSEHPFRAWLGVHLPALPAQAQILQAAIAAAVLAAVALVVLGSRSANVYRAVALVVIVSMLLTPLLTSQRVAAYNDAQSRRTAAARAQDEQKEVQELLGNPESSQQAAAQSALLAALASDSGTDSDGDGRTDIVESLQGTNVFGYDTEVMGLTETDDGTDSDGDGLTDYVESLVGTDVDAVDSDADQVSDDVEIAGFSFPDGAGGTRTWYTDPEAADTNGDGLTDGEEWDYNQDGAVDDTDGDSVPDLFDDDNDGDDVADSVDISPYTSGGVYDGSSPFSLVINGLTPQTMTYVEFQARPTNEDHLWYAYNVFDWPTDREGQIQDDDGVTFFDLDSTTDPNPDDNGDLKMVPMLEILIDGGKANLPSQADLSSYGIYTITVTEDGSRLAAYVPLQVVDGDGGSRAAFYAKMLYLPGTDWGNAQQVRMVWVLQTLVDVCETYEDNECSSYSARNQAQPVITYDDEWILTGLSIREDHGMDMAFIYEDPALDTDLNDDLALYSMAYGLEHTFLAGRARADGRRDLTVHEIARRFDHAANSGVSTEERWGIDNRLSVVSRNYAHRDIGLMTAAMTETTQILDGYFSPYAALGPITPTIMAAREERYRATNLDTLLNDDPDVVWDGNLLRINMTTERVPVQTIAGLSWAPYQYDVDRQTWYASPIETYWDELERRYADDLADETADSRTGHLLIMQVVYVTLYRGATSIVQIADFALQQDYQTTDKPLAFKVLGFAGTAVKFVVNTIVMQGANAVLYASRIGAYANSLWFHRVGVASPMGTMKALAIQLARYLRGLWNGGVHSIKTLGAIAIVALAVLTVVIIGLIELGKAYLAGNQGARIAVATVVGVAMFALTVIAPCLRVINLIQATRAITGATLPAAIATVLAGKSELAGASKVAGIVGLIIAVAITWGVFLYAVLSADLPPGSIAFNTLLAQTIAATIWVIVQFALATTVVGAIIVALIAVIDLVISLLGYGEYSISALITKYLGKAIYHYDVLVDTNVDMGPFAVDLARPLEGMIDGAQMRVRTVLTTTATHKDPTDPRLIVYAPAYYTQSQLRRTSFVYSLTEISTTITTDINAMSSAWRLARDHTWGLMPMYRGTITSEPEATVSLSAGINHATDLVLNTGYALPGVECWTVPIPPFWYPVPICYPRSIKDNNSAFIPSATVLDVFPATIDEFVGLTWANDDDFLHQRDHDGDGLISPLFSGNDPNDETWDADGDGLADRLELEMRQLGAVNGGGAYGPLDPDTDSDGMTDRQELAAGTNPSRRDSDGDLLTDAEEVYHQDVTDADGDGDGLEWIGGWTIPIVTTDTTGITSTLTVFVRSDPFVVDADGDGMGDATERTLATLAPDLYPFLPQVWNESPVKFFATIDDEDAIVGPEQTFVYSATVANLLALDHYVLGTITTTVPSLLASTGPVTTAYNLFRDDSATLVSHVTVPATASDTTVSVGSEMFAYQHDGDVRTRWDWSPIASFTAGSTPAWPWYSDITPNAASSDLSTGYAYALATVEGNYTHDSLSTNHVGNATASGAYLRFGTATIGGANKASWSTRPASPGPIKTTPSVVCAEDTGRCLTVWADDNYNSCTTVTYNDLYCHSEEDGPGSHSEFYIEVGGSKIWGVSSTATGERETINLTRSFCTSETYDLWEEDDWPNGDDGYGSATFYALSPGSGSHRHTGADVTISWYVHPKYIPTVYGRLFEPSGTPVACNSSGPMAISHEVAHLKHTPVAASDGTNFLVAWEMNNVLWLNRLSNTCTRATTYQLSAAAYASSNPALVWAGDRYLLVWQKAANTSATADADIFLAEISATGSLLSSQSVAATPAREAIPAIAYDPTTGKALIVYTTSGTEIWGRLWTGGTLGTPFRIATGQVSDLDVAHEPTHGGWMVMWVAPNASGTDAVRYIPLSSDGSGMLQARHAGSDPEADLTGSATLPYDAPSSVAIACRAEVPDPIAGECGIVANPATPDSSSDPRTVSLAKLGLLKVLPWVGTYSLSASVPVIVDATGPVATIAGLSDSQYLTSTQTLIIGGDATDNTNVAEVRVRVDDGPWELAGGAESWAYAWDMRHLLDGPHAINVYAIDVAGNVGAVTTITVVLDGTPPTATTSIAPATVLGAAQNADGQWSVSLLGTVSDAPSGTRPGSGAVSVGVLVSPNSTGWQTATISGNAWTIDYLLAPFDSSGSAGSDPSGAYTATIRAADRLANTSGGSALVQVPFYVDTTPPETSLTYPAAADTVIHDGALSFTGVVTDPIPPDQRANVGALEIAVVPSGERPEGYWQSASVASPGEALSTWSAPIGNALEGHYEVSLRGTDTLGNRNDDQTSWCKWQGEIDTMAPRAAITVTYRGAGRASQTLISGSVQDSNLVLSDFDFACAIQAADRSFYRTEWWDEVTSVQTRLAQITPSCIVQGHATDPILLRASDRYGHATAVTAAGGCTPTAPMVASAVITPAHEAVLPTLDPVDLVVGAFALDGLRAISMTVNGTDHATTTWPLTSTITDTFWSTSFTPPAEGAYEITTVAEDVNGIVQTDPQPIVLAVDTQPPQVTIDTAVLTTTHRLSPGRATLVGTVTDTVGLEAVRVATDTLLWDEAQFGAGSWSYPMDFGDDLDGEIVTIHVQARDGAREQTVSRAVVVDLEPPQPMTVTLTANTGSGPQPVEAGDTVRASTPTMSIQWTSTTDGAGAVSYYAGWSTDPEPALSALTPAVTTTTHAEVIGEPQSVYAHVVAVDIHGNYRVETVGPIIVDAPTTPDYVADVTYYGWLDSGCSLLGADYGILNHIGEDSAQRLAQRLYGSWDSTFLRLTWTGANWDRDGDLFVYLDSTDGGATTLYDPYASGPDIALPGGLLADYVIHVRGSDTADFVAWSGGGWVEVEWPASAAFQHNTSLLPTHTDILVPLAAVGSPTSIGVVGVATADDALRIWATVPDKNPLNSPWVINPVALNALGDPFALQQSLILASLVDGVCPSADIGVDAALSVDLMSEPAGVQIGYLEHDLPALVDLAAPLDVDLDGLPDRALPVDLASAVVGNGQTVTYTLYYQNDGEGVAPAVSIALTAHGALSIEGGSSLTLSLGDIPPGATGVTTVTGVIYAPSTEQSAELNAVVSDARHGIYDRLYVLHRVDTKPPEGLDIGSPNPYAMAAPITIEGTVRDASSVPMIDIQVRDAGNQIVADLDCPDATPDDGAWTCPWDLSTAPDGMAYSLSARATDHWGNRSEWMLDHPVIVDGQMPTVRLSMESLAALSDELLTSDDIVLDGQVDDDRQAAGVELCASSAGASGDGLVCERHSVDPGTTRVGTWRTSVPVYGSGDGTRQTIWFIGRDQAGNASLPLTRTARIDVVPPAVSVITREVGTVLGLPTEILAGTISDGYAVDRLEAKLTLPGGAAEALVLTESGGLWSFTREFDTVGEYSLSLDAWDVAGNRRHLGPFLFTVLGGELVADTAVAGTPSGDPAITGRSFVYTTTVTNNGPAPSTNTQLLVGAPQETSVLSISNATCAVDGKQVSCNLGDVPASTTRDVVLTLHVPLTMTGKLRFEAQVTSEKIDFRAANDSFVAYITTYQPVTGLSIAGSLPTPLSLPTVITATTATGTDVVYSVDFGDGTLAQGVPVTNTFGSVGRYTAVVTASNAVNTVTGTVSIPVDVPVARSMLSEDFDEPGLFPPAGWLFQRTEAASDDITWQYTEQRAHSGRSSTYHNDLFGWHSSWLVTPQVTPTLGSEVVFWQLVRYVDRLEGHSVWISTARSDPKYGDFVELSDVAPDGDDTWTEQRLGLDAYVGVPIYIAFRYDGDFATEWYLDDVAVTAPLLATNDGPTPIGSTTHFTAVIGAGTNISTTWDFGDGARGTGVTPLHTYALPGTYHATVTVQNAVSVASAETVVIVEGPVFRQYMPLALSNYIAPCLDSYEPDDTRDLAAPISIDGTRQDHSFHTPGDVDWISFVVGDITEVLTIETFDLALADTVIYLYDSDGVSLLDWSDDRGPGDASSRLVFHPYHTGDFTLRIVNYYPDAGDCNHLYSVRVTR